MNIYSKSVINLVHINHAGRLKDIVYPLALLLFFAVFVAWNIRLPGLYMDAVNPDYMVIRYLEPGSTLLPMWYKNAFLPSIPSPKIMLLLHESCRFPQLGKSSRRLKTPRPFCRVNL